MSQTLSRETKIIYSSSVAPVNTAPQIRDYWQQFGEANVDIEQERLVVYIKHEDKSLS